MGVQSKPQTDGRTVRSADAVPFPTVRTKTLRPRLNNSIVACFCLFTKFVISFSRLPKITSTDLAPAMTLFAGLQIDVVRHMDRGCR